MYTQLLVLDLGMFSVQVAHEALYQHFKGLLTNPLLSYLMGIFPSVLQNTGTFPELGLTWWLELEPQGRQAAPVHKDTSMTDQPCSWFGSREEKRSL